MKLFDQYRNATRFSVAILSTIFTFLLVVTYPKILKEDQDNATLLLFILGTSSVYSSVYLLCLSAYEKYLWKYFGRRENFSGAWEMWVTYEFLERPGKEVVEPLPLPYTFHSAFRIEQTSMTLRFPEGYSAPNEVWKDRCSRITADGIDMSYEVVRSDKTNADALPPLIYGFEIVKVTQYDRYGRPSVMAGRMYHASVPGAPLYRGRTNYQRVSSRVYDRLLEDFSRKETSASPSGK